NAKNWADANNIAYMPPSFTLLRTITSKAFSYTNSPKLPESHLLHTLEEMESWMKKTPNPKVIKTCFGLAGQGHFLFYSAQDDQRHKLKLIQAFKEGLPLIGEPWVKRLLDFSTQWLISKNQEITYLGATLMENS